MLSLLKRGYQQKRKNLKKKVIKTHRNIAKTIVTTIAKARKPRIKIQSDQPTTRLLTESKLAVKEVSIIYSPK